MGEHPHFPDENAEVRERGETHPQLLGYPGMEPRFETIRCARLAPLPGVCQSRTKLQAAAIPSVSLVARWQMRVR